MNFIEFYRSIRTLAVLMLLFMSYGCGGGGGGGNQGGGDRAGTNNPPAITQVESVIGSEGGELTIANTGSPADGAKIIIPETALAEDNTITISHGETDIGTPVEINPAGGQIDFGPDGLRFLLPVHISIPYFDNDNDGIIDGTNTAEYRVKLIYYNESTGKWDDVAIVNRNAQGNLVEAETDHFSTYLVTIDSTAGGSANGGSSSGYVSGEYFVGSPDYHITGDGTQELVVKGCIAQNYSTCSQSGSCRPCGSHYVLTVTAKNGPIKAVVDKRTTYTGGVPATINADGTGFIFDAASVFEKIKNSGDTALWTWRCEYIAEYTYMQNYVVCDDTDTNEICSDAGNRITPSIEVVDESKILFNLGIDISDGNNADGEPVPGGSFAVGDMIAIRFEANYI